MSEVGGRGGITVWEDINPCDKAKGLKHEPNDPSGPNLDDKIEELESSIRTAETDRAKCEAGLEDCQKSLYYSL